MSQLPTCKARAVADVVSGEILASVEVPVTLERAFQAITSSEITQWWIRPGIFETTEWSGDIRIGGKWSASGIGGGGSQPFALEGEFTAIEFPKKLVHTWKPVGAPIPPMSVTYYLDKTETGARITLRQSGVVSPDLCRNTAIGWETSFDKLSEILNSENNV
jgi:uncharacterized protein YndB with AHSA1/START domain